MAAWDQLRKDLDYRYGAVPEGFETAKSRLEAAAPPALWRALASRGSVRAFRDPAPTRDELRLLAAVALAAPSKSDLQQRDLIIVDDGRQLAALKEIFADQAWTAGAPALVVVCANNRRQRRIHELRGDPFANDHLDAFFNSSVEAAILLGTLVLVAEAAGYGCCPISAIRNDAGRASAILGLPDHVFPVAALAIGRPAAPPAVSPRLPLAVTLHENRYGEDGIAEEIDAYDDRRDKLQPYEGRRPGRDLGPDDLYGWSEDKARQYSRLERADFGAFIRAKGFRLT